MTAARIGRLLAISCVVGAVGVVSAASASTPALQIVRYTTVVNQGGVWTLSARVASADARCVLALRRPSGSTATTPARARAGLVRWAIDFSPDAAPGRWQARVACGGAATTVRFTVRRAPVPVVVERFGFAQTTSGAASSFGIGAVVVNRSRFAAVNVAVRFTLLDAQGGVVLTTTQHVAAIPARTRFHVGSSARTSTPGRANRIRASLHVDEWSMRRVRLPVVSDVRLARDASGGTAVNGVLRNVSTRSTLGSGAGIYAVLFDASGNVIGGGETVPGDPVAPGARVPFRVADGVELTPVERVATVRVSVDPFYD